MQVALAEEAALPVLVAKRLGLPPQAVLGVVIVRKAIDARRYHGAPIQFTYVLDVETAPAHEKKLQGKIMTTLGADFSLVAKNVKNYRQTS